MSENQWNIVIGFENKTIGSENQSRICGHDCRADYRAGLRHWRPGRYQQWPRYCWNNSSYRNRRCPDRSFRLRNDRARGKSAKAPNDDDEWSQSDFRQIRRLRLASPEISSALGQRSGSPLNGDSQSDKVMAFPQLDGMPCCNSPTPGCCFSCSLCRHCFFGGYGGPAPPCVSRIPGSVQDYRRAEQVVPASSGRPASAGSAQSPHCHRRRPPTRFEDADPDRRHRGHDRAGRFRQHGGGDVRLATGERPNLSKEAARRALHLFIAGGEKLRTAHALKAVPPSAARTPLAWSPSPTGPQPVCPPTLNHSVLLHIPRRRTPRFHPRRGHSNIGDAIVLGLIGLEKATPRPQGAHSA